MDEVGRADQQRRHVDLGRRFYNLLNARYQHTIDSVLGARSRDNAHASKGHEAFET